MDCGWCIALVRDYSVVVNYNLEIYQYLNVNGYRANIHLLSSAKLNCT